MAQQHLYIHTLLRQVNAYQHCEHVERQVGAVIQFNAALRPALGQLMVDDHPRTLLVLKGTIPIEYRGGKYYIPIDIWLPERYPNRAPVVFVTPTEDMKVKPNHAHVDVAGRVYIRYLHTWSPSTSTLVELASMLSVEFSNDPPVYRYNPAQARTGAPAQRQGPRQPASRDDALARAEAVVHERLHAFVSQTTSYVNRLMAQQVDQKRGEPVIAAALQAMNEKRDSLKEYLGDVVSHTKELEEWCDEHEAAEPPTRESLMDNIEQVVRPANAWSRQAIDGVALDHAIDDTLYCMDKALQDDRMELTSYLKKVRSLARDQFFARALCMKIEGKQMALLQLRQGGGGRSPVSSLAS